jgi:DNA repair exonuclease SbcCD ATPase subunit
MIDSCQNELFTMKNRLNVVKNEIQSIPDMIGHWRELNESSRSLELWKYLSVMASPKGLSVLALQKILPELIVKVNSILVNWTDFEMKVNFDDDKPYIRWYRRGQNHPVSIHSGMESLISNLAFKMAISQSTSVPHSGLLIVDEGLSVLDKTRLANLDELIDLMTKFYNNVMIITHIQGVHNHTDGHLTITTGQDGSTVTWI